MANKLELPSWGGTLFANTLGCLILFFGFKYSMEMSKDWNQFLRIGFLGSLTTFSTFAFEASSALAQGKMKEGLLIICLNMFVGIIAGIWILR